MEAKQVAQQDAERARFVVMKADQVQCCHECDILFMDNFSSMPAHIKCAIHSLSGLQNQHASFCGVCSDV